MKSFGMSQENAQCQKQTENGNQCGQGQTASPKSRSSEPEKLTAGMGFWGGALRTSYVPAGERCKLPYSDQGEAPAAKSFYAFCLLR